MGGVATIKKDQENEIRRYLFGHLPAAEEESLELRLLTEPAFVEEFDTVVDEVTDQYVRNELKDEERKGFEKSFLSTAEGRQKVRFTSELLERAAAERGATVVEPVPEPGFLERLRGFWEVQSLRLAATTAAVVIIAGGLFFIWKSFQTGSTNYAAVNLTISNANRADVAPPQKVKLESGVVGLEVKLAIPEEARGAKDYSAKLVGGGRSERNLSIERSDQIITAKIPASYLPRGNYAIQMFSVAADGTEKRIPGSYYFDVE